MDTDSNHKVPFFVLGAQRSGTTMLRLMLNQHSNIAVPHETGFITEFFPRVHRYGDLSKRDNRARLIDDIADHHHIRRGQQIINRSAIIARSVSDYSELIDAILSEYARFHGKSRWGDKTPSYTSEVEILWQLFPMAKFVHIVRDGRDVVVSQRNMSWMPNNLPRLARDWAWATTLCHKVGTVIGAAQYLEVRYEDLVLQPQSTLAEICEFIGESFEDVMLEYDQHAREAVPPGSLQWHMSSVQAPDKTKISRWKTNLSRADQIIFEQVAGPTLDLFGYERTSRQNTFGSRLRNLYYSVLVRW